MALRDFLNDPPLFPGFPRLAILSVMIGPWSLGPKGWSRWKAEATGWWPGHRGERTMVSEKEGASPQKR